jgi:hypothetical protein
MCIIIITIIITITTTFLFRKIQKIYIAARYTGGRYQPPSVLNHTMSIQRIYGDLPSFLLCAFIPRCGQRKSLTPLLIALSLQGGDYVRLFRISNNVKYNMKDFILFKQVVSTIEATRVWMTWERMSWLKNKLVMEEVSRCMFEGTDRSRKWPDIAVRLKSNPTEVLGVAATLAAN